MKVEAEVLASLRLIKQHAADVERHHRLPDGKLVRCDRPTRRPPE